MLNRFYMLVKQRRNVEISEGHALNGRHVLRSPGLPGRTVPMNPLRDWPSQATPAGITDLTTPQRFIT